MAKNVFDERVLFTPIGGETLYQSISFLVTSVTATNAISLQSVLLFATQDCHIRFSLSGEDAVATDPFIPANIYVPMFINNGFSISAIRDAIDGTLHISPVI